MTAQRRAFEVKRRDRFERMSLHEAGHAVVAHALGAEVERLWCGFDDRGGEGGHMVWDSAELPALEHLAILVAGGVAECRVYDGPAWDSGDRDRCYEIAAAQRRDVRAAAALIVQAEQIAERILDRHWTVVTELARKLFDRGRMAAADVEPFLRGVPRAAPLTKTVRSRPVEQPISAPDDLITRGAGFSPRVCEVRMHDVPIGDCG
jgi:hypothetical protein